MTLYTRSTDPPGGSECVARCAQTWPPLAAGTDAKPTGRLGIIQRKDGTRQWAYDGKALYTWQRDKKPGDVTGHKVGDVWFIAQP